MTPSRRESELLLYTAPDGAVKVGVLFRDEIAWLTQKALSELFGVGVPAIAKHLKNISESGELDPGATISRLEIVRTEGEVTRNVAYHNLDAIIAVGRGEQADGGQRARATHGAEEPIGSLEGRAEGKAGEEAMMASRSVR